MTCQEGGVSDKSWAGRLLRFFISLMKLLWSSISKTATAGKAIAVVLRFSG
jgi:hypothetical protein